MASLVLKMSVSLDGYVAPIDGSTDWIAAGGSDDALSWTVETVSNAGAHLMGATTYAVMAAHWPGASGPFAESAAPQLVASVDPIPRVEVRRPFPVLGFAVGADAHAESPRCARIDQSARLRCPVHEVTLLT